MTEIEQFNAAYWLQKAREVKQIVVCAWVDPTKIPGSCVWLLDGKENDIRAAIAYMETYNKKDLMWAVMVYPSTQLDPLGDARAEIARLYQEAENTHALSLRRNG
jgi:hypothetical protein